MSRLTIDIQRDDDITIVTPVGRIDVQQMLQLRNFFKDLEDQQAYRVAFDLHGVTFIDSYGVSVLTNFSNRLKLQDGGFVFFNCRKETKDFLSVAGINQIIPILDTAENVKEYFASKL